MTENNSQTKQWLRRVATLVAIIALVLPTIRAQHIPERPTPPRLVNDMAGLMSERDRMNLEDSLVRFDKRTSTQVTIVTVPTIDGDDPASYTQELGEKWGVGQKWKNNGVVILVVPKTAQSKGRVHISTGYGVEGALPDVVCTRIAREKMIPHFAVNDYNTGIREGAISVMQAVDGEYTAEPEDEEDATASVVMGLILLAILIMVIVSMGNEDNNTKGPRTRKDKMTSDTLSWILLNGALNSSRNSDWGSFSGGRGSFGGGFGGFGGGSFGGGGGGASW